MAIIGVVGRKTLKVRLLVFAIYAGLVAGAATMVYPFLLMIAGSTKSAVDTPDAHVIPPYLANRTALYQKYAESLFNESLDMMRVTYDDASPSFLLMPEPKNVRPKFAAEWDRFCRASDLPFYAYMIGDVSAPRSRGVFPYHLRRFKHEMIDRFDGDIHLADREMGTDFSSWNAFYVVPEEFLLRRNKPAEQPLYEAFRKYKSEQPIAARYYSSAEGYYKVVYLQSKYGKDLAAFNAQHGTAYTDWREIHLDRKLPAGPGRTDAECKDWEEFVRTILNLFWIRADAAATPPYREFLRAKYETVEILNRNYGTRHASFDHIPLFAEPPAEGLVASDWDAFLQGWKDPLTGRMHQLPLEHLRVHSIDFLFRDHLKRTYGEVSSLNAALDTQYKDWLDILPPQQELHYLDFLNRTGGLRWEFTTRNFITVFDYIVLHGRGVLNTAIYCALAVLVALIVNPMAAYALSRYKPPSTYKVLLFLMLTMAFPPMVTQIPSFLMLREFRLLNTFWALILPGLANGYSIFLLKGFFDSLPRELYESAQIDGASEWKMFWGLTMNLSKPILAVIALNAFTLAYSNFMMAMLICQDQEMWTLMPWLYQLQQYSGQGVIFASLIIAAVPTCIIFTLCQNVIMRGIVVPVEK